MKISARAMDSPSRTRIAEMSPEPRCPLAGEVQSRLRIFRSGIGGSGPPLPPKSSVAKAAIAANRRETSQVTRRPWRLLRLRHLAVQHDDWPLHGREGESWWQLRRYEGEKHLSEMTFQEFLDAIKKIWISFLGEAGHRAAPSIWYVTPQKLAVDAVLSEPVSAGKFPANR